MGEAAQLISAIATLVTALGGVAGIVLTALRDERRAARRAAHAAVDAPRPASEELAALRAENARLRHQAGDQQQ